MDIVQVTTRVFDTTAYSYTLYKRVCETLNSYTRDECMKLYTFINDINIENKSNDKGIALIIDDPRILYTSEGLEAQLVSMRSDSYINDVLQPAELFYVAFDEDGEPNLFSFEVAYKKVPINKVTYSFADVRMPKNLHKLNFI